MYAQASTHPQLRRNGEGFEKRRINITVCTHLIVTTVTLKDSSQSDDKPT